MLMKNILNIGTLILFFQVTDWIKKPEYHNKISEFYLLILSTLIGMNFMISAGDFLMFYIGLELATIPIAALAAYDTAEQYQCRSRDQADPFFRPFVRDIALRHFHAIRNHRNVYFAEL